MNQSSFLSKAMHKVLSESESFFLDLPSPLGWDTGKSKTVLHTRDLVSMQFTRVSNDDSKLLCESKLVCSTGELRRHLDRRLWWPIESPQNKSISHIGFDGPKRLCSYSEFHALSDGKRIEVACLLVCFVQGRYRVSPRYLFSANKSLQGISMKKAWTKEIFST